MKIFHPEISWRIKEKINANFLQTDKLYLDSMWEHLFWWHSTLEKVAMLEAFCVSESKEKMV